MAITERKTQITLPVRDLLGVTSPTKGTSPLPFILPTQEHKQSQQRNPSPFEAGSLVLVLWSECSVQIWNYKVIKPQKHPQKH